MESKQFFKNKTILILSHFYKRANEGGGPPQEIRDFFLPIAGEIAYIEHPFPYADDKRSSMTIYKNGKEMSRIYSFSVRGPSVLVYFLTTLIGIIFILRSRMKFDICIALDNLNTVSVLPMRSAGFIRNVIFYTIDYTPQRFDNTLLNSIYHFVDRIACYYSDAIWILSERMNSARKDNNVNMQRLAPSILLPMGANIERIIRKPMNKIKRHQIVFAGHLLAKQGVELVLQAIPKVAERVPDVLFVIVGQGEHKKKLENMTSRLKITKHVVFKGFVEKHVDLEKILCDSAIAVAPYVPTKENYTYFTDPGKPKLYMGCGLPVVITNVPAIAQQIQRSKAGIMIAYDVKSTENALLKLLTDDTLYKTYRGNAIKLGSDYNTNTLIEKALFKTYEIIR